MTVWGDIPDANDDKYWLVSARLPEGDKKFLSLQFSKDLGAWVAQAKAQINKDIEYLCNENKKLKNKNIKLRKKLEAVKKEVIGIRDSCEGDYYMDDCASWMEDLLKILETEK